MKKFFILILACMFLFSNQSKAQTTYADLIIWNGKIITVDPENSIAQAVAVKDSLILDVGTNTDIMAYKGPDTDVRNLNSKTVTPGMIDLTFASDVLWPDRE